MLSDLDDDFYPIVNLFNTLCFPYRARTSKPVLVFGLLWISISTSTFSSFSGLNIVDALKLRKSRRGYKSNLMIDFDSIDVCDVKHLASSLYDDVLFIFPPLTIGVCSAYGRSMDDIGKMCDKHPWYTTKKTNIQNDFGGFFKQFFYASRL